METPPLLQQRWARSSLDADADAMLGSVEQGLSVRLIATPRDQLETCKAEDNLRAVATRNEVQRFDFLPVVRAGHGGARIHGLIQMTPFLRGEREPEGGVCDHMKPLSEENLISVDAGILTFVRNADTHQCRLVIAGTEIVGLVSLSDLQRLPVRPVLFMLITHLELLLAEVIRAEFGAGDGWMGRLSPERCGKLGSNLTERQNNDMENDPLLMTQFCDKVSIIGKRPDLPVSRRAFKSEMTRAEDLRNAVAHANDFAATPEAARQTCITARIVENWIDRLRRPPFRA